MENMRTQWSHTGTASDINHFFLGILDEKFSVRTRNGHFVTRLGIENKRRTNAWIHFHPIIGGPIPGGGGNTNVQLDDIAFGRVVGHGIGPENGLGVHHFEIP